MNVDGATLFISSGDHAYIFGILNGPPWYFLHTPHRCKTRFTVILP